MTGCEWGGHVYIFVDRFVNENYTGHSGPGLGGGSRVYTCRIATLLLGTSNKDHWCSAFATNVLVCDKGKSYGAGDGTLDRALLSF